MLLGHVLALMKTKRLTFDTFSGRDKRNFKKIRSIMLTPFPTVLKEVLATKMADITVSIKDIICLMLLNNTSAHASHFWYISLLTLQK